ncbi:trifunctional hydroxymethylpyrimidine kinase/phosphomethylpyrimidine kinase/thiaminase [Lecanora helva]
MDKRRILVIAGSDSSGGAGLEADQKVIAAHLCYAMTATTALTAQNTQGVLGIHYVPSDFVAKQIDACISDIGVDVVKVGMLASADTADAVADALKHHGEPITVVDPVMVSTSGAQLLPNEAVFNLRTRLLPLTTILTPNIPEARLLLQNAGVDVSNVETIDDIVSIAKALHKLGPRFVLVKGGHQPLTKEWKVSQSEADRHSVVDILYDGDQIIWPARIAMEQAALLLVSIKLDIVTLRLTGSTAAIACGIALSNQPDRTNEIPKAVEKACQYVEAGISMSTKIGHGNGPINHSHSLMVRPPPSFISSLQRSIYQGTFSSEP